MDKEVTIIKIVVTGPESTGKSSLCAQLAEYFQTNWVPEYAREYLLTSGKEYQYEDLFTIAEGQMILEDRIVEQTKLSYANNPTAVVKPVFIDTDLQLIKVWSEFVYDRCDNRILQSIANRKYNFFLLCKPDMPWVPDVLREYPDLVQREMLYHHYRDALIYQTVPWIEIGGTPEERFQTAVTAILPLLQ